jgi:hypothetical protein
MEIIKLLLASAGLPTLLVAILGFFQNRKINRIKEEAAINTAEVDYSDRIIKQSDERVKQAIEDRNRAISDRDRIILERDAAYIEVKGQRKAKQEWRDRFYSEQEAKHAIHIELKDAILKFNEEKTFRCEIESCTKRRPPRKIIEKIKKIRERNNGKASDTTGIEKQ